MLQGPAGSPISLQVLICSFRKQSAVPSIINYNTVCQTPNPTPQWATHTMFFCLHTGTGIRGMSRDCRSENGMSQLQVRDLAVPKQGPLWKWNRKVSHSQPPAAFPDRVSQGDTPSESLHCHSLRSTRQSPAHPALPTRLQTGRCWFGKRAASNGNVSPKRQMLCKFIFHQNS